MHSKLFKETWNHTLYGDPQHSSHRDKTWRKDGWIGTCPSVEFQWVCLDSMLPLYEEMTMYFDPNCLCPVDMVFVPLSHFVSRFPFCSTMKYQMTMYFQQTPISYTNKTICIKTVGSISAVLAKIRGPWALTVTWVLHNIEQKIEVLCADDAKVHPQNSRELNGVIVQMDV